MVCWTNSFSNILFKLVFSCFSFVGIVGFDVFPSVDGLDGLAPIDVLPAAVFNNLLVWVFRCFPIVTF